MFREAFTFASIFIASSVTPGPDTMTIFSRALSGGRSLVVPFTAGIVLAKLTLLTLAIFGLAAIAQIFGEFLTVLQFAGAVYLLWMGINTWRRSGIPQAYSLARDAYLNVQHFFIVRPSRPSQAEDDRILNSKKNTDCMSQNLADQAVLKMPEIMDTNLSYAKTFRQMRTNRFNKLSDAFAKSKKLTRQVDLHIFPNGCDDSDPIPF